MIRCAFKLLLQRGDIGRQTPIGNSALAEFETQLQNMSIQLLQAVFAKTLQML